MKWAKEALSLVLIFQGPPNNVRFVIAFDSWTWEKKQLGQQHTHYNQAE